MVIFIILTLIFALSVFDIKASMDFPKMTWREIRISFIVKRLIALEDSYLLLHSNLEPKPIRQKNITMQLRIVESLMINKAAKESMYVSDSDLSSLHDVLKRREEKLSTEGSE